MTRPAVDEIGKRYGRLVVIGVLAERRNRNRVLRCLCECGNESSVIAASLHDGNTKSCGCLRLEIATRQGNKTHGLSKHPLYATWRAMRQRCNNPNRRSYADYGGRGIRVDPRWNDFTVWLADMGPKPTPAHSIDRIDNGGDYTPANCRWSTRGGQIANQRQRVNVADLLTAGLVTQEQIEYVRTLKAAS